MKNEKFSISKRLQSFKYAFEGLKTLFIDEHNARIHLIFSVTAIILGFYLKISVIEWIIITLCIGFVLSLEAVNSSIENLADFVSPDKHPLIKKVKDLASSAVLISAITAFIVGCIVFIPKIIDVLFM